MSLQIPCLLEGEKRYLYYLHGNSIHISYTHSFYAWHLCQEILRLQGFLSHFQLTSPSKENGISSLYLSDITEFCVLKLWQGLLYKVSVTPLKWKHSVIKTLRILHLMRSEQIWEAHSWFGCVCSRFHQLTVPWTTVKESEDFRWVVLCLKGGPRWTWKREES